MSDYLNLLDASTFFVVGSIVALTTLTLSIIGSNHLLSNKDDPMRNDYKHPLVSIAAVLFIFVTCSIVAFLGGYLYLGIYEAFKTGEISIPIWILAPIIFVFFVYGLFALLLGFSDVLDRKFGYGHPIIYLYALLVTGFTISYFIAPVMYLIQEPSYFFLFDQEFWFKIMFFPFNF
tara:strand:+ start:31 stop:558 length:528 start_codon:yes stop_codon:yes gene_type:complete